MPRTLEERFWQKVAQGGDGGDCWVWTASLDGHGYAQFNTGQGRMRRGHRVAWELMRGEIPEGLVLDHLCLNKVCVNPYHLDPVPQAVNLRRAQPLRTHCVNGHPFSGDNLGWRPTERRSGGHRVCRTCHRARMKETYRRRMARARGEEVS